MPKMDLLVFCHLRWDFVYQRPQHLMKALSAGRRVTFVEEPFYDPEHGPHWEKSFPLPNLTVCRPHSPDKTMGFSELASSWFEPLLEQLHDEERLEQYIAWVYSPMALTLFDPLRPAAVVYDCMDDLASFKFAPPDLQRWEQELLRRADVVFTGGPSLYQARKNSHPNIHCFPSSVAESHFAQSRAGLPSPIPEAERQASLPRPRLGYFGVIDERIDLDLIRLLAESHPEWQIVMVGPAAKIDARHLPRRDNILYTGQAAYEDLPGYLVGWDVCLLPFAINEATRYISPTKTLEYMAARRPIVSTPITDVVEPYGDIVYIGRTAEQFVGACEAALQSDERERVRRAEKMARVLARTSWEATALEMEERIEDALRRRAPRAKRRDAQFS